MELKIVGKKEEPLLSRIRVEAEIAFEKTTPSRGEIKGVLAKDLCRDERLIVVKGVHTYHGSKKAKNLSYVYDDEESLKRIEPRTKEKKGGGKKKEAKEEAKPAVKK